MNIQLDTLNKTININENININDFFKFIKKILPNDEWKEYTLNSHSGCIISTSTIIDYHTLPYYQPNTVPNPSLPNYPWYYEDRKTLKSGIYNINVH